MTLLEIKSLVVAYFPGKTSADFTINGQDLILQALNQGRRTAELNNDFEFQRRFVTLSVDPVTGASLGAAVDKYTGGSVTIKTIVDSVLFDDNGNSVPVEWTTVSESLTRQRIGNQAPYYRYPTDAQAPSEPRGIFRYTLRNGSVYPFPLGTDVNAPTKTLGMEVYAFSSDWVSDTITVAGTLSPDVTGAYSLIGVYNGRGLYFRLFGVESCAFIWWSTTDATWVITFGGNFGTDLGATEGWQLAPDTTSQSPVGSYTPVGYTGTATVTATGASYSDEWTLYGNQYLQWYAINQLNYRFKEWVPRTEGNLPPPSALMQEGLQAFIDWDANMYEQHRTHGR